MPEWLRLLIEVSAPVGVLVAAGGVLSGLYIFRRQVDAETFREYSKRYSDLMRDFPVDPRIGGPFFASVSSLDGKVASLALDYLNLCAEEHLAHRCRFVSKRVWRVWDVEIKRALRSPLMLREWPSLRVQFVSDPEFSKYVEDSQRTAS